MALSTNIRKFRKDKGFSQEYICGQLFMSQPTYSRLESSDSKCALHINRIATALATTPETLQDYHLTKESDSPTEMAEMSLEEQLAEKEAIIKCHEAHVKFLNNFIEYTQAVWQKYLRGEPL